MKSLDESVVTAMDGSDVALIPFLPYILQDTWEIGADPAVVIGLVRKNTADHSRLKVLDLGCGKGAISVRLAREFSCSCLGIDALKDFINEARQKAAEYGVAHLCRFERGDIRTRVRGLSDFHVIVLGAIGPVFGDYCETLTALSPSLSRKGIIVIDDGYIENGSGFTHPLIQKKEAVMEQIQRSGMKIIDEAVIGRGAIKDSDERIFQDLKKRCLELMERHPDKRNLFEDYIKRQEVENDVLETKIICSTMVIGKK